ncbi:MAG: AtpZ/AtpI family protein [Polyangiaceae bacterium]
MPRAEWAAPQVLLGSSFKRSGLGAAPGTPDAIRRNRHAAAGKSPGSGVRRGASKRALTLARGALIDRRLKGHRAAKLESPRNCWNRRARVRPQHRRWTWVGQKPDGWLGTGPWMTALWLVFGLVAGIRAIVRASAHLQRETEELERQEREERKRYHERKGHDR